MTDRDILENVLLPVANEDDALSSCRALKSHVGDTRVTAVHVIEKAEGAPVAGRKLESVSLPRGSLVVSDENANKTAGPETVLNAGKRYIVAVEPDVADEVTSLFRG